MVGVAIGLWNNESGISLSKARRCATKYNESIDEVQREPRRALFVLSILDTLGIQDTAIRLDLGLVRYR